MPTAQFYLTNAGRAAAYEAETHSIDVQITDVAFGTAKYNGQVAAPAKTALTTEVARFPLIGGGINNGVLRFTTIFTPTISADAFEIGLFLNDGTLFAVAAITGTEPLLQLVNGITGIITLGVALADIGSNVTVSVDANSPLAVSLINQHIAHGDPHTQYLLKTDFNAGVIALQNNKYDKTGGELNGNILLKGYLELTGGRTVAKLYAADFLRLELNHPLLINDAVNVSNVVAATDLTVSDNGSTSITHSNTEVEGNFVRFSSSRDKYVFDKPIHAPSFVGGNVSIAANGYTSLPNGLILQWGLVVDDGLDKNFPIAFPNQCFVLTASVILDAYYSAPAATLYHIVSNSVFRLRSGGVADGTINSFIAIGY